MFSCVISFPLLFKVFNRLREEKQTNLFKKLIAIAGDIGEENLGLSKIDRAIITDTVQIVFHSAATLDFEVDLKTTAEINLRGTRRVIQLCRDIKDLKVNDLEKMRLLNAFLVLSFLYYCYNRCNLSVIFNVLYMY